MAQGDANEQLLRASLKDVLTVCGVPEDELDKTVAALGREHMRFMQHGNSKDAAEGDLPLLAKYATEYHSFLHPHLVTEDALKMHAMVLHDNGHSGVATNLEERAHHLAKGGINIFPITDFEHGVVKTIDVFRSLVNEVVTIAKAAMSKAK